MSQLKKIVVLGGTGLIGTKLINILRKLGHAVTSASPRSGVNAVTGAGLDEAFKGVEIVVDVSNSPSFADKEVLEFFEKSGNNIAIAEKKAGILHHVALSVVGTERLLASGYFRAKLVQEKLIQEAGIPYTIIRATQFFEFLPSIAGSGTSGTIPLSSNDVQPIASDDVAEFMAEAALSQPLNGIREIGGPQRYPLNELIGRYLQAKQSPVTVVTDESTSYFGAPLQRDTLCTGEGAKLGKLAYEDVIAGLVHA